jgi:hypothetical protein
LNQVLETKLLLIAVLGGTTISTASWQWTDPWSSLATFGGALLAGMAAARITRIVMRATA